MKLSTKLTDDVENIPTNSGLVDMRGFIIFGEKKTESVKNSVLISRNIYLSSALEKVKNVNILVRSTEAATV